VVLIFLPVLTASWRTARAQRAFYSNKSPEFFMSNAATLINACFVRCNCVLVASYARTRPRAHNYVLAPICLRAGRRTQETGAEQARYDQ